MVTLKRWLKLYNNLLDDIDILIVEIECKTNEFERWLDGGDLARSQTYLTSLERQAELKGAINDMTEELEKMQAQRDKVVSLINNFKGLDNRILEMRYIQELSLSEIAVATGYSYQHIKNRHSELMRRIEYKYNV
ncbi:sigma factor-like helix-turn-helix DNA-binding protein [Brochothrix campestris]|uniref:RNA polymerase sigma-70 region 4 domain-containing protein n=1 Tax=Brochothrix campestris FSL F6-1037 TaxID=1265861 RepID=W7CEL6_9LIST|nr:sigma factor-like helix-turn-helix DNA-binding protein [Brochothrix campestris]EUJ34261.1 hypothetical protein BCAMP_12336 [Brochothrix campestris FSL F6-1037]